MLRLTTRVPADAGRESDTLMLTYEHRRRARQRVALASGREAGLFLERGSGPLRDGDLLRGEDGTLVRVRAAPENVSIVRASEPASLARVAYHLGNRHVALQIGADSVSYLHDHVLDDMVVRLGFHPVAETRPFEPEGGAYAGHAHAHADHVHADD